MNLFWVLALLVLWILSIIYFFKVFVNRIPGLWESTAAPLLMLFTGILFGGSVALLLMK